MSELLLSLWQREDGQDVTEYALLVVLIALVAIVALRSIGSVVSSTYSNAAANLSTTS